jgi:hypothetical protein
VTTIDQHLRALLVAGAESGYINHTGGCIGALSMAPREDCTCGLAQWVADLVDLAVT